MLTEIFTTHYREFGYALAPDGLDADTLQDLCEACDLMLARDNVQKVQADSKDLDLGARRRFLPNRYDDFPVLRRLVTTPPVTDIACDVLGDEPYLFGLQFVVKGAGAGAAFAWHQDSGYVGFDHTPYLTVWIPLDETTLDNGCIRVIPRDLTLDKKVLPHQWDQNAKEMVGYDGSEPGVALPCAAGSVIAFSSLTLHASGANVTPKARRALICQFTAEPLVKPDTGKPLNMAVPLSSLTVD